MFPISIILYQVLPILYYKNLTTFQTLRQYPNFITMEFHTSLDSGSQRAYLPPRRLI